MNLQKGLAGLLVLTIGLMLTGCTDSAQGAPTPEETQAQSEPVNWPKDRLTLNAAGVPELRVYVVEEGAVRAMDIETYVAGVLAGEMKNDWPLEALKAQAILARTFVLKFVQEKQSKYPEADISTDIEEAQAYAAADINDRVLQAVEATRGLVMASGGELPYAWFHAHSGGATDLASIGLGWDEAEPDYTQCVRGNEPETVSDQADAQALHDAQKWVAEFPLEAVESAMAELGKPVTLREDSSIAVGERGDSGRADTIVVDDQHVSAADLRIALGSTKMRSTLLSSLAIRNGAVHMVGRGYGHGVGMSQWGAYNMAQQGHAAQDIVVYYFRNVTLEKLW